MKLENKVALITGASGGIGKSIVALFLDEGAIVYGVDVNDKGMLELMENLNHPERFHPIRMDITSGEEVEKLFKLIASSYDRVDILVNNAGITRDKLIIRMSDDDWDKVIDVNLRAAFLLSRAAVKIMVKNRNGSIINISSVIALIGGTGQANYASSKAGLLGLTRALAKELASRNIRVNAVLPGFIETPMTESLKDEAKEEYLKSIPIGRFGKPEDVAKAVLFLASDDASYITGNFLFVDGGLSF